MVFLPIYHTTKPENKHFRTYAFGLVKNSRVARLTYLLFDGFVGAELARPQKEGGQGQPLQ
jgi:hypothetical protein